MTKSACTSFRIGQFVCKHPFGLFMSGDNKLANPFAICYGKRSIREIDHNNPYLTAIIGIDSPWAIDQRNTVSESQSASGADLCFIAYREFDEEACWNETTFEWQQRDRFFDGCTQIHTGRCRSRICRQGMMRAIDNFDFHCLGL